jgi:hypothetical protein
MLYFKRSYCLTVSTMWLMATLSINDTRYRETKHIAMLCQIYIVILSVLCFVLIMLIAAMVSIAMLIVVM